MKRNITVGYNESTESVFAVMWAAQEASTRGLSLHIVEYATGAPHDSYVIGNDIAALAEGDITPIEGLRDAVLAAHPDVRVVTGRLATDSPSAELKAEGLDADLLVVGASSHPGASGFWLGNTPRWLVRHSTCPIAVVRRPVGPWPPRRIVIGVDRCDAAVAWACREADLHHVPLVIVHVVAASRAQGGGPTTPDHVGPHADAALTRAVDRARRMCSSVVSSIRVEGEPVTALLDVCGAGDLLVLGTRRRGRVVSALFGSTVDGVLDHAHIPVVIVPEDAGST